MPAVQGRRSAQAGVEPGDGDELAKTLKIFLYKNAKAPGTLASPGARRSFSLSRRPNMKALLDHNSPTVNNRKNGGDDLPEWTRKFTAIRFAACGMRQNPQRMTLADYIHAVKTKSPAKTAVLNGKGSKESLPAWALCNDTGDSNGKRNNLFQLDFDGVKDVERLKSDLSKVPGILFAAQSASGRGVVALIHAPDLSGGIFAARQIGEYMQQRGNVFEKLDPACEKPCQLRIESYDPRPYIAKTADPIAPDYENATEMLRDIEQATRLWRADTVDFEAAATAIAATAIAARARVRYGVPGHERTFNGGCDVQIVAESGACKSQGGVMILRRVAEKVQALSVGGMRTTDARIYDKLLDAAFEITKNEKGRITGFIPKSYPQTCVSITDESGDSERSREGRADKAQANIIRRTACFDQEIEIGETIEMAKRCDAAIPSKIPCRMVCYRATTANQLDRQDMAGMMEGGNGRRTIYAEARPLTGHFDVYDELAEKFGRIPSPDSQDKIMKLSECLKDLFRADAVQETQDGKSVSRPHVFTTDFDRIHTARQAAKFAFMQAGTPQEWADTMIFNTALWIAVLRCGIARLDDELHGQFDTAPDLPHEITEKDIYAATAIALNTWRVVQKLTARGAAAKLAAARTDTERTRLILDYIGGRPQKRIARGNLVRKFGGRDVVAIVEGLCAEGVLRMSIRVNEQGKNPNTYYEITPEGETETAAREYAQRIEAKETKTRPKGHADTQTRFDAYVEACEEWDVFNPSENDNSLWRFARKLKCSGIAKDDPTGARACFIRFATSGRFNTPGKKDYTEKDAARLYRDGNLGRADE